MSGGRSQPAGAGLWPDYRTVWRWHFYAGLLCLPFVIWLSLTGSIYLFRPQIETWLDRPYDHLVLANPAHRPSEQVQAALAAAPGAVLRAYELPPAPNAAARVILSQGQRQLRVLVRPDTLAVMIVQNEDQRPMRLLFRLHGELLAGDRGSNVVELVASWTIMMLVTGLFLWWPRQASGLGGVLWPRLGTRHGLRDLHAVAGIWISALALFLLLTGLPWAKNWGGYLREVRRLTGTAVATQDWTSGRSMELAQRRTADAATRAAMGGEHADHVGMPMSQQTGAGYEPLDRLVPVVAALNLPRPVSISPPRQPNGPWTGKSDTPNRPQRVDLVLDPAAGSLLRRTDFAQRHWIDRVVGTGVAAHEGQLFGPLNQALGVLTAAGLVLMSVSSAVLWWRRRPSGQLGAPQALASRRVGPIALAVAIALAVYLPLLAASLILALVVERLVFTRIPPFARWLGLQPSGALP